MGEHSQPLTVLLFHVTLPLTLLCAGGSGSNSWNFVRIVYENENMRKRGRNMAQLWGGRFTKETDQLVYNFNASISFDQKFYEQDIRGSMAHVKMLAKQQILTEEEKQQILDGLQGILDDVRSGRLEITSE